MSARRHMGAVQSEMGCAKEERYHGGSSSENQELLLAVHSLERLLHSELKGIHKRCNAVQDLMDERTGLPLRDFDRRILEQDQQIKQLISCEQERSSRLQEHEVRLDVARTKLELHDQKLLALDRSVRWGRRSGELDRETDRSPASETRTPMSTSLFGGSSGTRFDVPCS